MHPEIAQILAEGRIADLHRAAAVRRLARQATTWSGRRSNSNLSVTWFAARAGVVARTPGTAEVACCPV